MYNVYTYFFCFLASEGLILLDTKVIEIKKHLVYQNYPEDYQQGKLK